MTWVRHGECNGCGFCCEAIAYVEVALPDQIEDQEFLRLRGFSPEGTKRLHIIDPCPALRHDKTCSIYETRPRTCREFPTSPDEIVNSPCSYWFENGDGEKIGGGGSPHPVSS